MTEDPRSFRLSGLIPLFLVSLFGISFETMLTRYFAAALYSEYSYWIISIAMVGYSLSGVVLTMAKDAFLKRSRLLFIVIPPLLIAASILAYVVLRSNPFNPLKLQNDVLWQSQVALVFLYYAGLFPVFFLAGLFVGLSFMIFYRQVAVAYAFDLLGAAVGAAVILVFMFFLHPYHLLAAILPMVFLVAVWETWKARSKLLGAAAALGVSLLLLAAGEYLISTASTLAVPEFKKLEAILNISSSKIAASRTSPAGSFLVMDDYLEFDDVSMTNNYGTMGISAPPRAYGLYKDNDRITSLLKGAPVDTSYVEGSLGWFPYSIRHGSPSLLVGTNGGYLMYERPGSPTSTALEPQPEIYRLIKKQLGMTGGIKPGYTLVSESPFAWLRGAPGRYSVIEIASDFLAQEDTNKYAFTEEATLLYLESLSADGILSIPADISEFSVYALKTVDTVARALTRLGAANPARNIIVLRNEWACQILASPSPFSPADIRKLTAFCEARSFDTSYYPGIQPSKVQIWNDLPPVSFESGTVDVSTQAQDALMTDILRYFSPAHRGRFSESDFFDLTPSTIDRPSYFQISRISRLPALIANISIMPRKEIGYLLNVIVLAEALLFAVLILFLPRAGMRRRLREGVPRGLFARVTLYFSSLGLAFFFVELALMEKFSLFLENATASFAVVLSVMLVFSGLGSWYGSRFSAKPYRGLAGAVPVVAAVLLLVIALLDRVVLLAMGASEPLKILLIIAIAAPLSFAMGRPFPLGNASLGEQSETFIPWAWAINGAFSVIATPIANIVSARLGWKPILVMAILLYASTLLTFPVREGVRARAQGAS